MKGGEEILPTCVHCHVAKSSGGVAEEDNRPNDLVIVLDGIDKLQPNLLKLFLRRHKRAPFRVQKVKRVLL